MHQRFLIPSLITCLSLNLLVACKNTQAQPLQPNSFDPATWPDRCQQLKKELANQPGINLVYQSHPESNNIQSSWQLAWLGKRIPIPAIQYSEVILLSDRPQDYFVLLSGTVNGQKLRVYLRQDSNQYATEDIFSTLSIDDQTPQTTPEGQALTKRLFGGSVTINQLATLAYSHKTTDLTCTKAQWEKEAPIALSLALKNIGIHTPTAAYRLDQGAITHSQTDQGETWVAHWDDQDQAKEVIFKLPKGQTYGKLGLGIMQTNWQSDAVTPNWLTALEKSLNTPNKSNWQSLAQAMKTAGLSKRSIDSVQKIINTK